MTEEFLLDDIARPPRRSRARRWLIVFAILFVLSGTGWSAYQYFSGHTERPFIAKQAAEQARAELRRVHGERWAPREAGDALRVYQRAMVEYTGQDASNFFVRNFDVARQKLADAKTALDGATKLAVSRRADQRAKADEAIRSAQAAVDATLQASRSVALGGYEQRLFQLSKLAVAEARTLFDNEEYAKAADRASLAGVQSSRVTERAASVAARFTDPGSVTKWRRMIDETVTWSRRTGGAAIVVSKENHTLTLYDNGRAIRTYPAELGYNSARDKIYAGDNATPEGRYRVTAKKTASKYHRALLLDYPNAEDRANFARLRRSGELPRGVSPGGLIEIHGEGGRGRDWTNGCVALRNREIDELFARVGVGTPVTIVGSDGSGGAFTDVVRMRRLGSGTRTD